MEMASLIGAGVAAIGSIVSGISQNASAQTEADNADTSAKIVESQAARRADAIRREGRRIRGQQEAAYGASGVKQEGSPLAVITDSQIENELDALTATYEGTLAANNLRYSARLGRQAGHQAEGAGIIGAGAQALSGYGNWRVQQELLKPTSTGVAAGGGANSRFAGIF